MRSRGAATLGVYVQHQQHVIRRTYLFIFSPFINIVSLLSYRLSLCFSCLHCLCLFLLLHSFSCFSFYLTSSLFPALLRRMRTHTPV
ncbi:hypothetical protein CSUI_007650 [Cystoisospora suis]|uniref:Transmembrane protein n=1 Tax=Cystoisospora suis TaxID=483139 RepID=A0A2C6KPW8_9APIC|nr:hypothetical protein CSUI_007650 [Cystoisospora suis]